MALGHAIRNAQDATPEDGSVEVRLSTEGQEARVEIADNGEGMDTDFVRERLFRPFDSTKGTQGVGIGAFQTREAIRAAGGTVAVDSRPGAGTAMTWKIPLANPKV